MSFFKKIGRKIRKVAKKAGRVVGQVAPPALPTIGGAIGGPGGSVVGGALGTALGQLGARGKDKRRRLVTGLAATGGAAALSGIYNAATGRGFFESSFSSRNPVATSSNPEELNSVVSLSKEDLLMSPGQQASSGGVLGTIERIAGEIFRGRGAPSPTPNGPGGTQAPGGTRTPAPPGTTKAGMLGGVGKFFSELPKPVMYGGLAILAVAAVGAASSKRG